MVYLATDKQTYADLSITETANNEQFLFSLFSIRKTKKKSLKVENGKDVQTVLSDASIKTIDGGYEEMNKEQSGREKSGR